MGLFITAQPIPVVSVILALILLAVLALVSPLAATIVLLILAPLRALIATEAPGHLAFDVGQIVFVGIFLAYAVWCVIHRRPVVKMARTPLFILLGGFLAISALSAFSATSLAAWLTEWMKWIQMGFVITLVITVGGVNDWRWLVAGLVLAGVANALVGIYEFLGGSGALHLLINDRFFRAFGTFGQPNPFGGFMGLVLPLALMLAFTYGFRLWTQWRSKRPFSSPLGVSAGFYLASAIILLVGLIVSWSRGAWIGFATSLTVLVLALPQKAWHGILWLAVLGSLLVGLWTLGLLPQSVLNRIGSATEEYFTFTDVRGVRITSENYAVVERLAHWQAALSMASRHPWFGVGLGNYEVVYPDNRLTNWRFPLGHAHNYYLNILAEAGIIGLLGYGKVWLGTMWLTWRVRRHPDLTSRALANGLLGSWTYLSVHSLFDNLYVNNLFLHIGLMLGVLAALYNQTWKHHKVEI
jgi:O-antigen ligase